MHERSIASGWGRTVIWLRGGWVIGGWSGGMVGSMGWGMVRGRCGRMVRGRSGRMVRGRSGRMVGGSWWVVGCWGYWWVIGCWSRVVGCRVSWFWVVACRGLMVSWLVWRWWGCLVTLATVTLGSPCVVTCPDVLVEDCAVGAVVCVLLAVSVAKVIDLAVSLFISIESVVVPSSAVK